MQQEPDPITKLNSELSNVILNFHDYHTQMEVMRNYYLTSVFYKPKSGYAAVKKDLTTNLLRVFADKLIHYTSGEPKIKVSASPEDRQQASVREKIIYATRTKSNYALLRRRYARDAALLSAAVNETGFDHKNRCAFLRRYDPRHCYWQLSNDNDRRVIAFWAVFPITLDECKERYGVTPTSNGSMPETVFSQGQLKHIDGKTWFLQAIKWTAETKTAWVGNEFIEEPHNHQMGEIPIDVCMPLDEANENGFGSFYIAPLTSPQAELNHVNQQRANIVDRMANPVVWGRNIITRQFDDVKTNLSKQGGGFVGLGRQGELGLLQVNDVKLLNEHEDRIMSHMMRLSGFGAATFGESVGANTSGDALSMYFTPTQRLIEDHNIAWKAFDESINAKILRAYDRNMTYGEKIALSGFAPTGTVQAMEGGGHKYTNGAFTVEFTKQDIAGNYNSVAIQREITPKDELALKTWALQAVRDGVISRPTAYEMFDILSPEDELALLTQEKSEPLLNPEGTQAILQTAQQAAQPAAEPAAVPAESVAANDT